MKTIFTTLVFLSFFGISNFLTAQIYVDSSAVNGNSTGLDWQNAYTDLQNALGDAEEGDTIWVAKGTYLPGETPSTTFSIEADLRLLGGFSGNETIESERDPIANPTILSGDLEGNDVVDDFTLNKSDNVMTILTIGSAVTNATLIDGFTIQGGFADGTQNNHQQRGGGIYSEGVPIIKNCILMQNYALKEGGAVYQKGQAGENLLIENCRLENNQSTYGGGISINTTNFQLNSCDLINNSAIAGPILQVRGGGIYLVDASGTLEGCNFTGNTSMEYGGGLLAWNMEGHPGIEIELLDCIFQSNIAGIRGGGAELVPWGNNADFTVHGCQFLENDAGQSGGGLDLISQESSNNVGFTVDSCTFQQNNTEELNGGGGGLLIELEGSNNNVLLANSSFTGNSTALFGTAAIYGDEGGNGNVEVTNCTFENNTALYSGGLEIGSLPGAGFFTYTISDCTFTENHATETGGGIDLYGESASKITVERCTLRENSADISGGGILVATNHPEFELLVSSCILEENHSPFGAGVVAFNFTEFPGMTPDAQIVFENCLMTGNTGQEGTFGLTNIGTVDLRNCTFAYNPSGGIYHKEGAKLTLQNTILFGNGSMEFEDETDEGMVTSIGGNLIGDSSLVAYAQPSDFLNIVESPFEEEGLAICEYYKPSMESLAVDNGIIWLDVAINDLCDNARVFGNGIDIGAIESGFVASHEVIVGELKISPNPTVSFLNIQLPNTSISPFDVEVFDAMGSLLKSHRLNANQEIDVQDLPSGMYLIRTLSDNKVFTGQFIKQ